MNNQEFSMMKLLRSTLFIGIIFALSNNVFGQNQMGPLHLLRDSLTDQFAYLNSAGDTVIPLGKYSFCFTEVFDKYAIVSLPGKGFVGIDRKENIIFSVYVFDNGPDYPEDGLFRITDKGKIGYADTLGNIIVKPRYDCAYTFEKGIAKVGYGCLSKTDGEHSWWVGGKWLRIDKKGNVIKK
jgi:WG containing repeat